MVEHRNDVREQYANHIDCDRRNHGGAVIRGSHHERRTGEQDQQQSDGMNDKVRAAFRYVGGRVSLHGIGVTAY